MADNPIDLIMGAIEGLNRRVKGVEGAEQHLRDRQTRLETRQELFDRSVDPQAMLKAVRDITKLRGEEFKVDGVKDPVALAETLVTAQAMVEEWLANDALKRVRKEAIPAIVERSTRNLATEINEVAEKHVRDGTRELAEVLGDRLPALVQNAVDKELEAFPNKVEAKFRQLDDRVETFISKIELPKDGATGPAGQGFNWKGPWKKGTYEANDVVELNGSSYIATAKTRRKPSDRSDVWDLFASAGHNGQHARGGGGGTSTPVLHLGTVLGEAGMVAKTAAKVGDNVFRTDTSGPWMLFRLPATDAANWVPLGAQSGATIDTIDTTIDTDLITIDAG